MGAEKNIKLLFILIAIMGGCSFALPSLIYHIINDNSFCLLPLISKLMFITQALLFLIGFILGVFYPKRSIWPWGLASVILMPFISIVEMTLLPNTHNLWPIEFLITYPFFACFCMAGSFLGKLIRKTFPSWEN